MRTRQRNYPSPTFHIRPQIRKTRQSIMKDANDRPSKMSRVASLKDDSVGGIDILSDDLLISIIIFVGSTASSSADLFNAMLTCRRFCAAATHPLVLARAAAPALQVQARSWSEGAHRFLKSCADAGNVEACYTLGMIRFYCLDDRSTGALLMEKAASVAAHTSALHSLAIIQFNGSGGIRKETDLKAGVALCATAATLGHVDAMRELGHCLQHGYGVFKNIHEGNRLLFEANAREAAAAVLEFLPSSMLKTFLQTTPNLIRFICPHYTTIPFYSVLISKAQRIQRALHDHHRNSVSLEANPGNPIIRLLHMTGSYPFVRDFGSLSKLHPANKFLIDWFVLRPPPRGLRLCSHQNCGRVETRKNEFMRCSACGYVYYCSRNCQALDWKVMHRYKCMLM